MEKKRLGFAMTGSFCTWASVVPQMEKLAEFYEIYPIFSPISYCSDNRFGKAADWIERVEGICGRKIWHTIEEVELYQLVQKVRRKKCGYCFRSPGVFLLGCFATSGGVLPDPASDRSKESRWIKSASMCWDLPGEEPLR